MSNAESLNPSNAELSDEDYHKLVAEVRRERKAAVRAELLDWAQTFHVGRLVCDCCERTLAEIGEPCRRPGKWHYRRLRRRYANEPDYRYMIDRYAELRLFDEATAQPDDMTAQ